MLQPSRCIVAAMPRKQRGEKLTAPQVAERLGITASAWRGYVSRARKAAAEGKSRPSDAPMPDGEHDKRTPWWWESTVDDWRRSRRGQGWRAGAAE